MHLDVTLKPGAWIEPPKFFQQIADAGYEARRDEARLTLLGRIEKDGDRLLLLMDDVKPGPQKFVMLAGKSKNEKEAKAFADAFKAAGDLAGKAVELEGDWRPADKKDKNALPSLILRRLAEAKSAEKPEETKAGDATGKP